MNKHILIIGKPRSGKTTIIKRIFNYFKPMIEINGFWTVEVLSKGKRVGFDIETTNGEKGILASINPFINPKIDCKIGKYYVSTSDLENKAIPFLYKKNNMLIIDEIGKMEISSQIFKKGVLYALDNSPLVVATIGYQVDSFSLLIKKREDITLLEISSNNRENIYQEIITKIRKNLTI